MSGWRWCNPPNTQFRLNKDSSQARGLVAWWPIVGDTGSTILDYIRKATTSTIDLIWQNYLLDFDGTNDYLDIAYTPPTLPLTFSMWLDPDDTSDRRVWGNTDVGPLHPSFGIRVNSGSLEIWPSSANVWITLQGGVTTGRLNHLAVVIRSATNIIGYVDGAPGTEATNGDIQVGNLRFGDLFFTFGSRFDGRARDLRIYNRELSAQEIWQLYAPQTRWELYEPLIPKWIIGWVAAGGTTYNQSISGGITPTATLINQAQKVLVGSVTPTSSLIKQLQKVLTGGVTPTGTLLNQTQKVLSGNIIPNGSLLNQAQKALVGSITPISALTNQTQKVLSGSITPSGILAKAALISLIGSLTPSGTLTNQVQKILSGAISPLGQLLNQAQKVLSGNVTPGGVLTGVKTALVNLVGSLTPSGTLSKETQKLLSGSLTPVGSILKQASKIFTGVLTPIGVLAASLVSTNLESTFKGMFRGMFRRMK